MQACCRTLDLAALSPTSHRSRSVVQLLRTRIAHRLELGCVIADRLNEESMQSRDIVGLHRGIDQLSRSQAYKYRPLTSMKAQNEQQNQGRKRRTEVYQEDRRSKTKKSAEPAQHVSYLGPIVSICHGHVIWCSSSCCVLPTVRQRTSSRSLRGSAVHFESHELLWHLYQIMLYIHTFGIQWSSGEVIS